MAKALEPACWRCEDQGWFWTTPVGFNPFLAGGFRTAATMYRALCSCAALTGGEVIEALSADQGEG